MLSNCCSAAVVDMMGNDTSYGVKVDKNMVAIMVMEL